MFTFGIGGRNRSSLPSCLGPVVVVQFFLLVWITESCALTLLYICRFLPSLPSSEKENPGCLLFGKKENPGWYYK